MRARKVSILLTVTAISALTLFLISLLESEAAAAPVTFAAVPDTLAGYEEKVIVGSDGSASVEITVVVGRGGLGDLLLPFDFDDGSGFSIPSGPASFRRTADGESPPTIMVLGRRMLNLEQLPTAVPGDTIRVAAEVPGWFSQDDSREPYGEFSLERRFVNSSAFVLRDLRLSVVLPPGMLVHSIEDVQPAYNPKKSPTPPFSISRMGDRGAAMLRVDHLPPTSAIRLQLNIRPVRRGPIPLVIGIVFAVLYLVFFRDVLKPREVA